MTERSTNLKKVAVVLAAVIVAQVVAYAAYEHVESTRVSDEASLSIEPPVPAEGRVSSFQAQQRSGERVELIKGEEPIVLHFWATWCPPCRDELPALLRRAEEGELRVAAVAIDDDWKSIEEFAPSRNSTRVFLGDKGEAGRAFGVQQLPHTVLIAPDGTILARAQGARDWSDDQFVSHWKR